MDLVVWTQPVFRRESVKRQEANTDLPAKLHDHADGSLAAAMAFDTAFTSLLGLAPISIHDNGYMLWQTILVQTVKIHSYK